MTVPPRKYFSEITIGLNTKNAIAIQPDELMSGKELSSESKGILDLCHIYAICRRPALRFDPDTLKHEFPVVSGDLVRIVNGETEKHPFEFGLSESRDWRIEISRYPHRKINIFDKNDELISEIPSFHTSIKSKIYDRSINDFEVLYIGQAFGDGSRTAFDRLKSHTTLQKILADLSEKSPDDEVVLFLFEYEENKIFVQMDGMSKDALISGEEDLRHLRNVFDNPLTQKEEICIAEAGLIWYFSPVYNIKLKNGGPKEELKLLSSCYNLDISGIVVEINTEEFPVRLLSNSRPPGHHHIAKFDLHDPKTRRTFFSLVDGNGG